MFFANCTYNCGKHNLRAVLITQPKMLKKARYLEDATLDVMSVVAVPNIGAGASIAGRDTVDTPCHIAGLASHKCWVTACDP